MSKGGPGLVNGFGSGAPSAPNPNTTAAAQTTSNINSAEAQNLLNNVNIYSPYGSSTFSQTGSTDINGNQVPQYSQSISLSPGQQAAYNAQLQNQINLSQGAQSNLASKIGAASSGPYGLGQYTTGLRNNAQEGPIQTSFSQGQGVQGQVGMPAGSEQAINDARNAAYNQQEAYLAPQQAQQGEQLNASLAQQGITQGSTAYNNAESQQGRQNTFSNQQAQDAAIQAGQQEQNTLYGQALQSGEFANTAAGQQYTQNQGEAGFANTAEGQQFGQNVSNAQLYNAAAGQGFGQRQSIDNMPYNQYASLNGLTQIQNPQANAPAQSSIAPAPIGQYINQNYQNQMGAYNNQQQGLYGLGGTALTAAMMMA